MNSTGVWFGCSSTTQPIFGKLVQNRTKPKFLKVHACLVNFPLASKIMVRSKSSPPFNFEVFALFLIIQVMLRSPSLIRGPEVNYMTNPCQIHFPFLMAYLIYRSKNMLILFGYTCYVIFSIVNLGY